MSGPTEERKKLAGPPQEFLGPLGGEPSAARLSGGALIDEFVDALWLADGLAKNTLSSSATGRPPASNIQRWPSGRSSTTAVSSPACMALTEG